MSYVIRARYVQPDGIGWVGKEGQVYHDPGYAHRFDTEDEAWGFLGLNYERLGDSSSSWPEEARDYTPEEKRAIRAEYDRAYLVYYGRLLP